MGETVRGDATMDKNGMTAGGMAAGLGRTIRRLAGFLGDRRGVAAIEFAFIAPFLLTLYFVTMEVAQGIETNKKVSRVGSMVADLVTQQHSQTNADVIEPIMEIGGAILHPYGRTKPTIVVTGIDIKNEEGEVKAVVAWSRQMQEGTFTSGPAKETETTVPKELNIPGTFLIRVSAQLDYRPFIAWTAQQRTNLGLMGAFDNINMDEVYYLRPRMSNRIDCTDC
mgnify:CR=1 FL=1